MSRNGFSLRLKLAGSDVAPTATLTLVTGGFSIASQADGIYRIHAASTSRLMQGGTVAPDAGGIIKVVPDKFD